MTSHLPSLSVHATDAERAAHYQAVRTSLTSMLADEDDEIARMATIAGELHHSFDFFHWTGFYRALKDFTPKTLVLGPYQGGHGCLRIAFDRGVCGRCARLGEPQLVADVLNDSDHIACSSSTRSEVVIPIFRLHEAEPRELIAVLDIDSDAPNAFSEADVWGLTLIGSLATRPLSL